MSDSDSDSCSEFHDYPKGDIYDNRAKFVALTAPGPRWGDIPIRVKKSASQLLNIFTFWFPILLFRQEGHATTRWAVEIGVLDPNENKDLSLKRLYRIEILEAILKAMEKGCFDLDQATQMIHISNRFNMHAAEVFDDAILWLERSGGPRIRQQIMELGHYRNCFMALQLIFTEYAHHIMAMSANKEKTMSELGAKPCGYDIGTSEALKGKGNEYFQKKRYDAAIKWYSQAIRYRPENHIIYGNRALCYIRCEKHLKAVVDGKRAVLLQPEWAKGHYRYCEALFSLGEHKRAVEANLYAQVVCKEDRDGIRDLLQQHSKFSSELNGDDTVPMLALFGGYMAGMSVSTNASAGSSTKSQTKRPDGANKPAKVESKSQTGKPAKKVESRTASPTPQSKVFEELMRQSQAQAGNKEGSPHIPPNRVQMFIINDEADKTSRTDSSASAKQKTKGRNEQAKEKKVAGSAAKVAGSATKVNGSAAKVNGSAAKVNGSAAKVNGSAAKVSGSPAKVNGSAAKVNGSTTKVAASAASAGARATSAGARDARDALRSAVQDGHSALTDQRSRNAEQSFSQALALLDSNTPKELGISTIDAVVLIYGRASALIDIGQTEELAGALRDFERIKAYEERKFQCLVFYGIGKVYLKENRFPVALRPFSDSLQMVKNQITPGKLTWPMTKEIIKETQPDYLKELLEKAIEACRFPPIPDAICRHQNCTGHSKVEIYFTDPDFKGFIQMICCENCTVQYHISCWKTLKMASFSEKNEKDFLQEPCFTPSCEGKICSIKIYGSTGLIKCKFETVIRKPELPEKMRVNQKCTSLKKLKSKEDRKLKRKQHRQASQDHHDVNDDTLPETTVATAQEKASALWQLYRDRVLLQISESQELFTQETCHNITALMMSLKPWMELDQLKGNALAGVIIGGQRQQPETLHQVVELLLERKNRVWARVFIQSLSTCQDVAPKLQSWAHQLNNSGLNAARAFIERYADHLEELDLALLINFAPLQDMLIEKFGTMPEFFSRRGLTVTEYLKRAPAYEMRLFIWTLEEHRDQYASCHPVLDEYFEMMDGHCLVLKRSENENENNPLKAKNRARKKKQKEPKPVIYLSGMRGGTPVDGDEDIFDDEDSLHFLDHGDPFSVPDHLREQVADFEGQYDSTSHRSHYKNILDNNPDPTKERLYDYFAQVLEEHGPLGAQDPLLVGQLDNFPAEAQDKIQEAGGLQCFLLESLRFVLMGHCVGLSKHAVSMHQAVRGHTGDGLNDLDVIGDGDTEPSTLDFPPGPESVYAGCVHDAPLPSPYVFGVQMPSQSLLVDGVAGTLGTWRGEDESWATAVPGHPQEPPFYYNGDLGDLDDLDLCFGDVDDGGSGEATLSSEGNTLKEPAAIQECQLVVKSDVAVNTMPYERYESNNGDMTKKEKGKDDLVRQIYQMVNNHDAVKLKHREAIASLEQELEKINANIQVANKELVLAQQKLEEEVKRDQKEKRENQETLKAMKMENKDLVEKVESLTRSAREKKNLYETKLNDFLELSNFSATEKMSLEDEIKRCIDVCAKAAKRSPAAELCVLESRRGQDMYFLYKSLTDARAILATLEEVAPRYPPHIMGFHLNSWRGCVQEAEEKISATEAQFDELKEQVKRGSRLSSLTPVCVPRPPAPPMLMLPPGQQPLHPAPQASYIRPPAVQHPASSHQPAAQSQHSVRAAPAPGPTQGLAAAQSQHSVRAAPAPGPTQGLAGAQRQPQTHAAQPSQGARPLEAHQNTVFDRVMERLSTMFPYYSRPALMPFIQQMRTTNNGSLSSLDYNEVVSRVTQIILDHQEQMTAADSKLNPSGGQGVKVQHSGTSSRSDSPSSVRSTGTPPLAYVWHTSGQGVQAQRTAQAKALNMEDPCIICHDDMSPEDTCVLECRHTFHTKCIKSWLKEQSTCPTCREHALLPEDFPMLPGRMRRGQAPAAFS